MEKKMIRNSTIFNSPFEAGLRAIILLNELKPKEGFDLQTLVLLDYILTHSGDIADGPTSLHADIPYRASAISVKRKLIEIGLDLMISRDLTIKTFSPKLGVCFRVSENTEKFLSYFESVYFRNLTSRANWINEKFKNISGNDLTQLFNSNFQKWDSEFSREAMERIFSS